VVAVLLLLGGMLDEFVAARAGRALDAQAIGAIKQNLVFSLGVLAVAVGLTIPGVLTAVTGALLHELSSIPVIGNSARLIGLREKAYGRGSQCAPSRASDQWSCATSRSAA